MQRWKEIRNNIEQALYKKENRRVLAGILVGLSLIIGIGLGIYLNWPIVEEELVVVNPVSREEMDAAVQAQVQSVIADLYPWVLDGPIQLVTVEPPPNTLPNPTEKRPEPEKTLSFEHLIWPVQGEIETPFGWYRHPVYGDWRFNAGLELSATGETVRTVLAGEVVSVTSNGLETELVINHGSGWSSTYRSIKGITVGPGEVVQSNQDIALPESSGLVFFGLTHNNEPVNPQAFLR